MRPRPVPNSTGSTDTITGVGHHWPTLFVFLPTIKGNTMIVVIHYTSVQGAILVSETVKVTPEECKDILSLERFAKAHLESLNLSQRCAAAIKQCNIYTRLSFFKYE